MFTLTLWSTYFSPIRPSEFFSGKNFRALIWQLSDLCSVPKVWLKIRESAHHG